jgi:DNA-binding transcriptional ArsR family regulator
MSTGALDPLIHHPERLRVVATLAALPDGDALSVNRLQNMIRLTPGSLTTRLRELDHAGYVRTEKTGGDRAQAAAALTCDCRAALDRSPPCCGGCHGWPGKIIRHQRLTCTLAMLTGTRPWVSTSCKAGSHSTNSTRDSMPRMASYPRAPGICRT